MHDLCFWKCEALAQAILRGNCCHENLFLSVTSQQLDILEHTMVDSDEKQDLYSSQTLLSLQW